VGDITEVNVDEVPEHDLLTAGFCCQSFSRAGAEGGLDDPRGQLFFEVVRIAAHLRPAALLLENVANLLEHDGGATIATITAELEGLGCAALHYILFDSAILNFRRFP
jgi:DNA (cytosine-5)-methyltransferase 1